MTDAPLTISRLHVTNFGRLTEVLVTPGRRTLTVLRGPNEAGKTSTIKAVLSVLAGKRAAPEVPIRTGTDEALVEITLADDLADRYRILRAWKGDKTYLHVYSLNDNGEASRVSGPQGHLDALVSDLSFDPLRFAKSQPRDQVRMLMAAIGKADDYDQLQARRAAVADERKTLNARARQLEADLASCPDPDPGRDLRVTTNQELADQLQAAHDHNAARVQIAANVGTADREVLAADQTIARLEQQLAAARKERTVCAHNAALLRARLAEMPAVIDPALIQQQIAAVDAANTLARQQARRRQLSQELSRVQADAARAAAAIERLDADAVAIVAASNIGQAVPGLAVTPAGEIQHDGLPLSQASGMRTLELSALLGMAASPRLRVMAIDEGDQLDDASIKRLTELARERDYSLWMTAIRAGDETDPDTCIVELREGGVVGASTSGASVAAGAAVAAAPCGAPSPGLDLDL